MKNIINVLVLTGKIVDTLIPIVSNVVKAVKLWKTEREKGTKNVQ